MSLRDRAGAAVFRMVAGPDGQRSRERIHGTPGPTWFEAGSPITRVHGDASMFVGGIRAILLQTLHPAAMTAVAEHSGYRGDMWGRLARTSTFIATTTFGTARHAHQVVDAVRRIHATVTGVLADGTPYAADDPHLLLWVHVAEIDSFLRAHDTYGVRPLVGVERDHYVAAAGEVAARLGVTYPPATEAELAQALASFRPELHATDHAREAVDYLMWHPELRWPAAPGYAALMAAAIELMPAWARAELELPRLPLVERPVVRLAGQAATRGIRWAMAPGHAEAERLRQQAGAERTGAARG